MSEIWRLYQLQRADSAIAEADRNLTALRAEDAHQKAFEAVDSTWQAAQDLVKTLKKELRELEMEDMNLQARTKYLEGKLYGGKVSNPKELRSFEDELAHVRARVNALEEDMLLRMEDLETRESGLAELKVSAEAARAARDERQKAIDTEIARWDVEKGHARERRQRLAGEVDPVGLRRYEDLRAKKHGVAVARVKDSACGGCRMHLTDHKIQEVKGPGMTFCSTCGRILYMES